MKIEANKIELVPIKQIIPNPNNRNQHTEEQIERLVQIMQYQGFRNPLIVSNRTGHLVAGHGRLLAAKKLKLDAVPVIYQDFEDEDQEFAAGVSDNAIASWAELDLEGINKDIQLLGPFDIDLLGIKSFAFEPSDFDNPPEKGNPKDKDTSLITCPNCGVVIEKNG